MTTRATRLLTAGGPWALLPSVLETLSRWVAADGDFDTGASSRSRAVARQASRPRGSGTIAVVGLYGLLEARSTLLGMLFGGVSLEAVAWQIRQLVDDSAVSAIVLDVDSPGGSVHGVQELADLIHAARGRKPIVAQANYLAASAAYWIASAADELVVAPSGEVGSIGVLAAHEDLSGRYAAEGIATTLISAGKYKTEATPYGPLSEEARGYLQERVDAYHDDFLRSVARGRGRSAAEVRQGFGQGRVVGAQQAVALGMADRVATLDQTLVRLANRAQGGGSMSAAVGQLELRRRRLRLHAHAVGSW